MPSLTRLPLLAVAALAFANLLACSSAPKQPSPEAAQAAAEFEEELDRFGLVARSLVDAATLAKLDQTDRPEVEKRLSARRSVVGRLERAGSGSNSLISLIDLWWCAEMLLHSAQNGQVQELFGEESQGISRAAEAMSTQIEDVALRYLPKEKVEQIKEKVVEAAEQEEILTTKIESVATGARLGGARTTSGGSSGGIVDLLSLPLSPFTAARSVETGVADVVVQAQEFNRQFQRLPDEVRRQSERLLQEFYLSPLARSTVDNLNAVGAASTSLAKTAEALPVQLREQAAILLEETRASQSELASTVATARDAAAEARATAIEVNAAISNLGEQSAAVDRAVEQAATTAKAWEQTVAAVQGVLDTVERMQGPEPPPGAAPQPPSFSLEELDASAVQLQKAAIDLQGVLDRVITLVDDTNTERVEVLAARTIENAANSSMSLVDAVFWRSLVVVGLAAAGLVTFGVVRRGK